jgi:hypothetical protein
MTATAPAHTSTHTVTAVKCSDVEKIHTRNALRRFGYAITHHAHPVRCDKCKRDLRGCEPVYWAVIKQGYGHSGRWRRVQGYICAECCGPNVDRAPLWPGQQPDRWEPRPCQQCGRQCYRGVGSRRNDWGRCKHAFCSDACAAAFYRAPRVKVAAAARRKVCTVCATPFDALRRDAATCSPACRQCVHRKRQATAAGAQP